MAKFAGGFLAASGADQFGVAPEGAVDEYDIAGGGPVFPAGVAIGQRRRDKQTFPAMIENEAHDCFLGSKERAKFSADVIWKFSSERNGAREEQGWAFGIVMLAGVARHRDLQRNPFDGRSGAAEHAENGIFFGYDAPHRGRRKDAKTLEFAQVQQAHQGVNIGAGEVDLANRRGLAPAGEG